MSQRLRIVLVLALVLAAVLGAPATAQTRFVSGTEDLPLMAGLVEVEGGGLVFDTPSGRLVEARAVGALSAAEVRAFYVQTLPQLGWRRADGLSFVREGEFLSIELTEQADSLAVRFTISPESF